MENTIKLNRFGVYYLPRKILEDGVSNKIKALKKKRIKYIKNNLPVLDIEETLEKLNAKRPCIVMKLYKKNVTIMPLTRSDADESHYETKVFNSEKKSYVKTSVILTISKERFLSNFQRKGNLRIDKEERQELIKICKKHYFL